jgi:hypothetical protein
MPNERPNIWSLRAEILILREDREAVQILFDELSDATKPFVEKARRAVNKWNREMEKDALRSE